LALLLRPRGSPLFPYTTLFRSEAGGVVGGGGVQLAAEIFGGLGELAVGLVTGALGQHAGRQRREAAFARWVVGGSAAQHQRRDQDRKSTRLNSSHVKISYAVFC